jgi:hypothetical protein
MMTLISFGTSRPLGTRLRAMNLLQCFLQPQREGPRGSRLHRKGREG